MELLLESMVAVRDGSPQVVIRLGEAVCQMSPATAREHAAACWRSPKPRIRTPSWSAGCRRRSAWSWSRPRPCWASCAWRADAGATRRSETPMSPTPDQPAAGPRPEPAISPDQLLLGIRFAKAGFNSAVANVLEEVYTAWAVDRKLLEETTQVALARGKRIEMIQEAHDRVDRLYRRTLRERDHLVQAVLKYTVGRAAINVETREGAQLLLALTDAGADPICTCGGEPHTAICPIGYLRAKEEARAAKP